MKNHLNLFVLISLIIAGCEKKETPRPQVYYDADVLILNEGNFGQGNATIDLYNASNKTIQNDVFRSNNLGRPIGDVIQSMYISNDTGFVVVNNSQKVEMVNLENLTSVGTINGFNSPRYFLPLGNNKAYVSDLYANAIQVVDIKRRVITANIPTNGWTEEMTQIDDTVYVTDMTNNELIRIDKTADTILGRTTLIRQPNSIVVDKNSNVWVLCSGGFDEVLPRLYQISTSGFIVQFFEFQSISMSPGNLIIDSNGEELYYLNESVFHHSISASALENNPLIPNESRLLYGLGFHPTRNELYVSDAIDYQQNGIVYRYLKSGELIHQFRAGIIPGSFQFIP
tara:strand:- start:690 stop:1712 length:1023 start_codon:yes stop_codon:yes gene_type:complete